MERILIGVQQCIGRIEAELQNLSNLSAKLKRVRLQHRQVDGTTRKPSISKDELFRLLNRNRTN